MSSSLLGVIETMLLAPLQAVLGQTVDVACGPAAAPNSPQRAVVNFSARSLRSEVAAAEGAGQDAGDRADFADQREAAHARQRLVLQAEAGQNLNYILPAGSENKVAEIHGANGIIYQGGDDYIVQGSQLRFYRAPVPPVVLQTRGERVRGYSEKTRCYIELELQIFAPDAAQADALCASALAAVLRAVADIAQLDLIDASACSVRLLKPLARVTQITREVRQFGADNWLSCVCQMVLRGDLEWNVVLGAAEETGVIKAVQVRLL